MKEIFSSSSTKGKETRQLLLVWSAIFLIWCLSIFLITHSPPGKLADLGQLATLLFGASSVTLAVFSIIIGVLAFFGWKEIRERIAASVRIAEIETDKKIETLESEIRGRTYSALGYMIGEMSIDRESLTPKDRPRLEEAVTNCQLGYELLKKVGGPPEYMGLNNLIYYSCFHGGNSNRQFLLTHARRLKEEAGKHSEPGASNVLLTACRAILLYSLDQSEIEEALATLVLLVDSSLPEKLRHEAALVLASASKSRE